MKNTIDDSIKKRRILITCGTGGVGKTTLSAAIAVRAALLGKRTVVITIDPAKRLATSLGLKELSNEPTDLTPLIRAAYQKARKERAASEFAGLPETQGETMMGTLAAIVPDTRKTFETFVNELAPSPAAAQRVMQNPIFQIFAKEFSGTNEYMALERLLALYKQNDYDCIILDTPPSRNTLAFLDAPRLLAQFFEERLIRWLIIPANKILAVGMKKALGVLERLTGAGFMTHLFDFASALFEVQVNFTAGLKKVTALLESPEVGFLMVTTPTQGTAPEALHFIETLKNHRFHFEGLALNRTLGYLEFESPASGSEEAFQVIRALQEKERIILENLMRNSIPICAKLPELARDIHSLEDLFHVALAFHGESSSSGHSGHSSSGEL